MPDPRLRSASACPIPPVVADARLPGAPSPPLTSVRDPNVRTASTTPMPSSTTNTRRHLRGALHPEQQPSHPQAPTRRQPGAGSSTCPLAVDTASAAPSDAVTQPTPPTLSHLPAAASALQQLALQQQEPREDAAAAAAPSSRPATVSNTGHARPSPAKGAVPSAKSHKNSIPERLREYRLLGSANASAFDVAARGGLKDNRVFAILPEDHPTRFQPYWHVRDSVNDALVDVGAVGRIATADPVKTGFALTLTRTSKIKEVLRHAEAIKIALGADEVALRKSSITMVISDVPVRVAGSSSPISDLDPFLADEIELALDAKLACPPRRMCKPEHLAARTTTGVWIAIDPESPDAARPRRIRLMQRWCHMRPFIDRSIPTPCDNCWSFGHSGDACSHPPRCQQCTSGAHGSEDHTCDLGGGHGMSKCVPLCNSCTGPHLPGDSSCKANPTFDSSVNGYIVPIGRRLQQIKQAASKDRVEAVKRLQKSLLAPSR